MGTSIVAVAIWTIISGVDLIEQRNVVDFKTNLYGEILIEFLINANMCILNGRNCLSNDFTSVSVKDSAIVDYCLVAHESLHLFTSFNVIRTVDLINRLVATGSIAPVSFPDHSVITWKIDFESFVDTTSGRINELGGTSYDKFDVSDVPSSFLSNPSTLFKINSAIASLEGSLRSQTDIDAVYETFCGLVRDEMYTELPYKRIKAGMTCNKKRRIGKPWWNDNLTELWNQVCEAERIWLRCTSKANKFSLKARYIASRKHFDREVQRSKRVYWYNLQSQLIEECNNSNDNFWRTIGRVGVGHSQNRRIPMEVLLENGSISNDTQSVLEKWKRDFTSLLNVQHCTESASNNGNLHQNPCQTDIDPMFNAHISVMEVKKAVDSAKRGKLVG